MVSSSTTSDPARIYARRQMYCALKRQWFRIADTIFFNFCSADLLLKAASASPKAQAEAMAKADKVHLFVKTLRTALHNTFRYGNDATRLLVLTQAVMILSDGWSVPITDSFPLPALVGCITWLGLRRSLICCVCMRFCRYGQGTRDMAGPEGLTTEKFIDKVFYLSAPPAGSFCCHCVSTT